MKKLSELSIRELKKIVESNEAVRNEYADYIHNCAWEDVSEDMESISACKWQFSPFLSNFLSVTDWHDFIVSVRNKVDQWGGPERFNEIFGQYDTTDDEHAREVLMHQIKLMWESMMTAHVKYYEIALNQVYNQDLGTESIEMLEDFAHNLSQYYTDGENVYKVIK